MAWSPTATISLGTFDDNFRSFVDNTLSSMPNWSVATPSGLITDRNMRYDMGVGNNLGEAGTGQYMYFMFDASFNKVNGHYNSNASATWENQESTTTGGLSLNASVSAWKVWTNSSLLDSFLVIDSSGTLVWGWFECQKWLIWGDQAGYPGTTNGLANTLPLGFSAGFSGIAGYPGVNSYNVSLPYWMAFDLDSQGSRGYSAGSSNMDGKVVQGFRMMCTNGTTNTGNKLDTVAIINTDQVLIQIGSTSGSMFGSGALSKVTDGTNWYLRTNGVINQSALLFPVGTSEPVFS